MRFFVLREKKIEEKELLQITVFSKIQKDIVKKIKDRGFITVNFHKKNFLVIL